MCQDACRHLDEYTWFSFEYELRVSYILYQAILQYAKCFPLCVCVEDACVNVFKDLQKITDSTFTWRSPKL